MKAKKTTLTLVVAFATITILYTLGCNTKPESATVNNHQKPSSSCMDYPEAYNVPLDANLSKVINHSDTVLLQHIADTLSWKTFIALNWPARSDGFADSNKCIGSYEGNTTTVWENWKEINQIIGKSGILVTSGPKDSSWIPKSCMANYQKAPNKKDLLILYKNTVPGSRNGINKKGYQLVDQNSNPTYYQIYYNTSMVQYIKKGKLNTLAGQKEFVKTWPQITEGIKLYDNTTLVPFESIFFSIDVREDSIVQKMNYKMVFNKNNNGAMMMKAAWKIMGPSDDTSKFYTRDAIVAINKDSSIFAKVGLVGVHIAHKTAESPQWIWSSFEHIDNVPELDKNGIPIVEKGKKYTFFNPGCTTCKINIPDTTLPHTASQIARELPIDPEVKSLNTLFQNKLRQANSNNVWQYYNLIGTQWPFSPSLLSSILVPAYPLPNGNPRPTLLSNTTMECFDQKTSCMGCHANAFILNKVPSDFVWGMIKAK